MTMSSTLLPVSSAHLFSVVVKESPLLGSSESTTFSVWPVGASAEPDAAVEPEAAGVLLELPPHATSMSAMAATRSRESTFFIR